MKTRVILGAVFLVLLVSAQALAVSTGTIDLASGGTATITFTGGGENSHELFGLTGLHCNNDLVADQSGTFHLNYYGNQTVAAELLMVALGPTAYDADFGLTLSSKLSTGSTWTSLGSYDLADFTYTQGWKYAYTDKPLISTGAISDPYKVMYVDLATPSLVPGNIMDIYYALSGFDTAGSQIIFNVYGRKQGDAYFKWTNPNDNTFGVSAVPLPASVWLLAAGLGGLWWRKRP